MKARHLVVFALIALTIGLTSCAGATPTPVVPARVYKFSLGQDEASSWYKGATKFADLVKQRTNGRIAISVFANASLAARNQAQEVQMLMSGGIDFLLTGAGQYANHEPHYFVATLPWLFASNADADKAMSGPLGQELLQAADAKGIVGLAWGENGFLQITNAKREIKTPDDVKGLKIRIPALKASESTLKALGAEPVKINSLSDTYAAMQNGTVDGQSTSVDLMIAGKFYDVQKYVTIWNFSYAPLMLSVNKSVWGELDPETQKIVRQAAVEACAFQVQEFRKAADAQLQTLKDKGTNVTILTPEQMKVFKDRVASVYTEFEPIVGKEFMNKYVPVAK